MIRISILASLVLAVAFGLAPGPPPCAASTPAPDWAAPWDTLSGPLDVPSFDYPRAIYDPVRHRIVTLVAGNPTQMWVMPLSPSGTPAWTQVDIHGPMPPARERFAAVYDSLRDRILVYGGFPVDTTYSDVWALSLAGEPQWSPVTTLGAPPPRDRSYTVILDTSRDRLVVFGGQADYATHISDLWELSLSGTPTWARLSPLYHPPWPRVEGSAVYDRWHDRMIFFGGQNTGELGWPCQGYLYNDTWALDFSEPTGWWPLSSTLNPPGRMEHTAIVDPEHRQMVVEGGHQHGTFVVDHSYCWPTSPTFEDAWALNLDGRAQWTPLPSASRATGNYTAAYSPERGSEIVFSGNWAGCYELNLRTPAWSQILPAMPDTFPPRGSGTLLVERDSGRLLLYAGGGLWTFSLGDTIGWTPLPITGTPAAWLLGIVYDYARNQLVAFSGGDLPTRGQTVNEVRALPLDEPRVWTPIATHGSQPPGRGEFSLAYDPLRDRVLLFGGAYHNNPGDRTLHTLDDLWSLSLRDASWTQLHPAGTPGPRCDATMLYDAARDRVVVLAGCAGGYGGCYQELSDTWALPLGADTLSWHQVNPTGPGVGRVVLDPLRDRLLLLNGEMKAWTLPLEAPTTWQPVPIPGRLPLPRDGPGVTFDPLRDELLVFGGTNRADLYGLRFSAAAVTLVSARSDSDHVSLVWGGMDPGEPMSVQRWKGDSTWVTLATLTADASGRIEYVDWDLAAGGRYGYRPSVPGANRHYAETWLEVPAGPVFGFRGAVPNPARDGLAVSFTLAYGSRARLEVFDLAGRRVLTRDLGDLTPGPHVLPLESGNLRPGVYLLRLEQGGRTAVARAVVLY